LLREEKTAGQVCVGCFYVRRFFRIVPLYFLTIALYLPGVWLSYKINGNTKGIADFNAALPWLLSFNSEWRPDDAGILFGHAWTLGIEEKFYIVWPLLFVFLGKRWFIAVAAIPFLLLGPSGVARGYIGIISGVITALFVRDQRGQQFISHTPIGVWFALMVLGYAVATWTGNLYFNLLVSLPSAPFIAALVSEQRNFYKSVLSIPVLAWLGTLTYAIYLIHRLVGNTFEQLLPKFGWHPGFAQSFLLVYLTCIPTAWLLHVTVEKPLIRFGRKLLSVRGKTSKHA
jgi:peptidoglycan/LPS O-acetylase OafA/YrhL